MLIEKLIDLGKVRLRTWNLGQIFEIKFYGWLVSNTIDNCLQRQIAKKTFKLKIEARPVNVGLYMATSHFSCDWFSCKLWLQSIQNHARHLSKLLHTAIWSCCAIWSCVKFESEHLLLCTGLTVIINMLFCFHVISLLRDQWMNERLSNTMSAALVSNNFLQIPSKILFHLTKKVTCCGPIRSQYLQSIETFFDSRTESV